MRLCLDCGRVIPQERLEVLPETEVCVLCSKVERAIGFVIWDQKTPELVVVNTDKNKRYLELERMDGRLGRLK